MKGTQKRCDEHDLEDVAGGDVLLGPLHHADELGSGVVLETGSGRASATPDMAGGVRQRLVERGDDAAQPLDAPRHRRRCASMPGVADRPA